jgi:uncharacterized membrane protein
MKEYLQSVVGGIIGTLIIILIMPIVAIIVFIAGLFGQIKFNEKKS